MNWASDCPKVWGVAIGCRYRRQVLGAGIGGIQSGPSLFKAADYVPPEILHDIPLSKILDIGLSSALKSDVPYCFSYVLASLCFTEMSLNLKHA